MHYTDKPEMLSVSSNIKLLKDLLKSVDIKSQITLSISHALKEMEYQNKKTYQIVVVLMPSIAARSSNILKKDDLSPQHKRKLYVNNDCAASPQWI